MTLTPTRLDGCWLIESTPFRDQRGTFLKTYQRSAFERLGLCGDFPEAFITNSRRGVLRGLHFQVPPSVQAKVVFCLGGAIFDALLDLRAGTLGYGSWDTFELDAASGRGLYVPAGVAHGFYARSDDAIVSYHVSREYDPRCDQGVLWNSAGVPWPDAGPVVSARDQTFPPITAFDSPFRHG